MVERPLTVAELNEYIKSLFDQDPLLTQLRIEGEISNWRPAASGHVYFSLKDDSGVVRCVLFRQNALRVRFAPRNGMRVILNGYVGVYTRDGQYQFYTSTMREAGAGGLFAAFEALKSRLAAEGLFNAERKQPLPPRPRTIGIVTSDTGAAIRDMIRVATRRDPTISLVLYPARVQGEGAAEEIARGIETLNQYAGIELIVVGRGGGSIEDLWAFNEEIVARAIAASLLPVVSAVGHETDFTIADFAADLRAPTPSAAMELCVPTLRDGVLALDELTLRLQRNIARSITERSRLLERVVRSPMLRHPEAYVARLEQRLAYADRLLERDMADAAQRAQLALQALDRRLEGLNPRQVLARGYAYVATEAGRAIAHAREAIPGARVKLQFQDGSALARIEEE